MLKRILFVVMLLAGVFKVSSYATSANVIFTNPTSLGIYFYGPQINGQNPEPLNSQPVSIPVSLDSQPGSYNYSLLCQQAGSNNITIVFYYEDNTGQKTYNNLISWNNDDVVGFALTDGTTISSIVEINQYLFNNLISAQVNFTKNPNPKIVNPYLISGTVSLSNPGSLGVYFYGPQVNDQNPTQPLTAQTLIVPANGGMFPLTCKNTNGTIRVTFNNKTVTVPGSYPDVLGFALTDGTTTSSIIAVNSGTLTAQMSFVNRYPKSAKLYFDNPESLWVILYDMNKGILGSIEVGQDFIARGNSGKFGKEGAKKGKKYTLLCKQIGNKIDCHFNRQKASSTLSSNVGGFQLQAINKFSQKVSSDIVQMNNKIHGEGKFFEIG